MQEWEKKNERLQSIPESTLIEFFKSTIHYPLLYAHTREKVEHLRRHFYAQL